MVRKTLKRIAAACLVITASLSSTAFAQAPQRPLVFVPGITGSVLTDDAGNVIWGDIGSLRGSNFHKMNLLPETGAPVEIGPKDALRDVPLVFGTIEVGLYSGLIDFLIGKQSLVSRLTGNAISGEYVEGETLFVFSYDWRRSNFANALALNDFIETNIPSGEFDIVAHSMGGLVTRIMLSQQGPNGLCTAPDSDKAGLAESEFQDLCHAIYGPAPSGSYPSDHLTQRRDAAERLHTFIEMAVPHYGSVNLAATLLEGWGKVSELLLGGKLAIQDTVLSMAAPVELLPTYDNCCARGKANAIGNISIDPYTEDYWLDLLLGFGVEPCPYTRCDTRRALFRNGIANRKIIDQIMDKGLPAEVKANHGIIGRNVKNTREVIYVDKRARGNGHGVSYRINAEGDGTVHRISALLPTKNQGDTFTNFAVVSHSSHPFIIGDQNTTSYVFNMLVDPIDKPIEAVTGKQLIFANGAVGEVGVAMTEQVVLSGEETAVTLSLTQQDARPFDPSLAEAATITATLSMAGKDATPVLTTQMTLDADASRLSSGFLEYATGPVLVTSPGIYTLHLAAEDGTALAQTNLYVLEK